MMPIFPKVVWKEMQHIDASRQSDNMPTIIYTDIAITLEDGTATLFVTDDRTQTGKAIFSNIDSVQSKVERNTTDPLEIPHTSLRSISEDNKIITINVVDGTVIYASILGLPRMTVPAGLNIYVTVIGIKNDN